MNWWRRNWWKTLGAAGVVGVAAGGVAVARRERQRRSLTPEEIRDRLHRRYEAITAGSLPAVASAGGRQPQATQEITGDSGEPLPPGGAPAGGQARPRADR